MKCYITPVSLGTPEMEFELGIRSYLSGPLHNMKSSFWGLKLYKTTKKVVTNKANNILTGLKQASYKEMQKKKNKTKQTRH